VKLDLGLEAAGQGGGPLPVTSSRMSCLGRQRQGCPVPAVRRGGSQVDGLSEDVPVAVLQPARGHHVDRMAEQFL
jgi:hypothetical protein